MTEQERKLVNDARVHLSTCITQRAPSDDNIIAEHIEDAYRILTDALVVNDPLEHIHRGSTQNGADVDKCLLCGRDIREHIARPAKATP